MKNNPLIDKEFLRKLDLDNQREIFAKIISLDKEEYPIEEISGQITQGTVSIDGSSSVRRTCSLTLVTDEVNINNYYWGLCTKFKLYIGLQNKIDDQYENIIWFPQGIFVVTDFKIQYDSYNRSIYISGKDKMCLLNGDLGGNFPSIVDLGQTSYFDEDDNETKIDNTLKSIIREMIHYYGNEPFHNILINDLDDVGLELLDFKGDNEMYLFKEVETGLFKNIVFDGNVIRYKHDNSPVTIGNLSASEYDTLVKYVTAHNPLEVKATNSTSDTTYYTIVKCESGSVVGYRNTELVYAGDLIPQAGDTITSVLDDIVDQLGDYEYFYDTEGRFIFQKKLTYLQTSWNNLVSTQQEYNTLKEKQLQDTVYVESSKYVSQISYSFNDSNLITSFQNTPTFSNIKNDFSVWGKKKAALDGQDNYIHIRCAIDEKPTSYTQITVTADEIKTWKEYEPNYFENLSEEQIENYAQESPKTYTTENYDWREIIYQMAADYLKYNHLDSFEVKLRQANPTYRNGKTGYEQYYTDLNGFWRLLYAPISTSKGNLIPDSSKTYYVKNKLTNEYEQINLKENTPSLNVTYYTYNINNDLIEEQDLTEFEDGIRYYYYSGTDLNLITKYNFPSLTGTYYSFEDDIDKDINDYDIDTYWNNMVLEDPASLLFWFDFLNATGTEIGKFAVPAIGDRTKVVNDDNIKAIYYGEIPTIIYITQEKYKVLEENNMINDGYTYVFLPEAMEEYFDISTKQQSAQDKIDELLYNYAYCNESINLTTIPVYYLQPNTRIQVYDPNSNINGEYILNKLSFSFGYNGTMSISATKAPENLY